MILILKFVQKNKKPQRTKGGRPLGEFCRIKGKNLAGVVGFEPTNVGVRVQCLTTWRYPITIKLYNKMAKKVKKNFKNIKILIKNTQKKAHKMIFVCLFLLCKTIFCKMFCHFTYSREELFFAFLLLALFEDFLFISEPASTFEFVLLEQFLVFEQLFVDCLLDLFLPNI